MTETISCWPSRRASSTSATAGRLKTCLVRSGWSENN